MPGISSSFGFGTSTSVIMVRVSRATLSVNRVIDAVNDLPAKRFHPNLHGIALVHVLHVFDGHRNIQPQQVIVRNAHQRHGLGVGCGAGLNERAGIRVAPGDHAVKGGAMFVYSVSVRYLSTSARAAAMAARVLRFLASAVSRSCCATRLGWFLFTVDSLE